MDGRTGMGNNNKKQRLLRARKNRKSWRVLMAHILKGNGTGVFGSSSKKLNSYKHEMHVS